MNMAIKLILSKYFFRLILRLLLQNIIAIYLRLKEKDMRSQDISCGLRLIYVKDIGGICYRN